MPTMEFGVLGPLQVRDAHGVTTVEGHRRRALLAVLLAHQGRTVPSTALIDALWPEVPPRTAHHTLHTHVSRLRHLHGVPVEAQDGGYRLDAPAVDAARFE
jgi:DNA-binding SARP family transcriptional activator